MANSNTVVSNRRLFIGGSDAQIIMGSDEAALLRLCKFQRWPMVFKCSCISGGKLVR